MKKASIITLILVLTATLFTGCRNMGGTTNSTAPASSSLTKPTVVPAPEITTPTSPNGATTPGGATNPGGENDPSGIVTMPSTSEMPGRAGSRPSARGPRY